MVSFIRYEFSSRREAIIGWGLGVGAFVLIYALFFPTLTPEMLEADYGSPLYRAIGQFDLATFEGYFAGTIIGFMALLIAIYAVVNGTGTLAGEEESGTLELLVTLPLRRWQIILSKAIAMALAAFLIVAVAAVFGVVSVVIVQSQVEIDVAPLDVVPPIMNAWPITVLFMMISLFFSALLPRRRTAATAAVLVLVVSFFGSNLLPMVESLEPLAALLPFHYYDRTVTAFDPGIQAGDVLILIGASLAVLLLAVLAFERRDLTVGAWFWRRGPAQRET